MRRVAVLVAAEDAGAVEPDGIAEADVPNQARVAIGVLDARLDDFELDVEAARRLLADSRAEHPPPAEQNDPHSDLAISNRWVGAAPRQNRITRSSPSHSAHVGAAIRWSSM